MKITQEGQKQLTATQQQLEGSDEMQQRTNAGNQGYKYDEKAKGNQ